MGSSSSIKMLELVVTEANMNTQAQGNHVYVR